MTALSSALASMRRTQPPVREKIFSRTGGCVLLIEARAELRAVMRDVLEVLGYEALALAPTDREALALSLERQRPEVVLVSRSEAGPRPSALAGAPRSE